MTAKITCGIINTLWNLLHYRKSISFSRACHSVQECQEVYLAELLRRNAETAYGRLYGFDKIKGVEQFQRQVPLTTYDDLLPYIDRIAQGEESVLTREKVQLFEPSSGSTSPRKLIPYTDSLRREFQHGIAPWIYSLYRQYPQVKQGKTYWSISPDANAQTHYGTIPVGFDDDSSYLGFWGKWFHSQVAVSGSGPTGPCNAEHFKTQTLLTLLAVKNLRLVSVWSPTFLTLLCEYFLENEPAILAQLASLAMPGADTRAEEIRNRSSASGFNEIWPCLGVISCWTDGASKEAARRVQTFFPDSVIQGKGLLATEAFVSFPYRVDQAPVLAMTSHFFEFLTEDGQCLAAHQVQPGKTYSVVVTTGGGLYRYQLGDTVLVKGFIGQAPTLEFTGKSDLVSDRFGEKLNATHVAGILHDLLGEYSFAMLAPDYSAGGWQYTLYVEYPRTLPPHTQTRLQDRLSENPNYLHCIHTGQLAPARIYRIMNSASAAYTSRLLKTGTRFGDIKLTPLSKLDGWSNYFSGSYENA